MSDRYPTRMPEDLDAELKDAARRLEDAADRILPDPAFTSRLERRLAASYTAPEVHSMSILRRIAPAVLVVLATLALIVVIDWMIRSLAPQRVPGSGRTPLPNNTEPYQPTLTMQPTPAPPDKAAEVYDWHGVSLSLAASLPDAPQEVEIYLGQPESHSTIQDTAALAQRFGIQGTVYQTHGEIPGTTDYVVTDGKQRLRVRSAGYVEYIADVVQAYNYFAAVKSADAEQTIKAFLESHGYSFAYAVQWDELRGGYSVQPLAADGTPLRYEYYAQPMMLLTLGPDGSVLVLRTSLLNVASEPAGRVGIISAEQALERLLDPNRTSGIIESMHSGMQPIRQWSRSYPLDRALTFYGTVTSLHAADAAQPAFVQLDGYPLTGDMQGLDQFADPTFVEATGRFVRQNGALWFSIDSWKMPEFQESSFVGTLGSDNGQLLLATDDGQRLSLPDAPPDLPLPFENAFIVGTRIGDTLDWKLIDNRAASGGGGGGGGGGSGFWKLNLSGTPVPFPTQTPPPVEAPGGTQYTVQEGDTLGKIAAEHNISVDALVAANNIQDPGQLMIGQELVIPDQSTQQVEGLRGMLEITISKQPDGSQLASYGFLPLDGGPYVLLDGAGLEALQSYNSRPVDVWGTMTVPLDGRIGSLHVDRFEIPFPDLKVQVLQGTQKLIQLDGSPATLFTTDDGQTFIQLPVASSLIGVEGDQVLLECVAVPGETFGSYPALRLFGGMLAVDPKSGLHVTLPITRDRPTVLEAAPPPSQPGQLSATVESIQLEHFVSDPRFASAQPLYFQPVWRFSGHYSNGDAFEVLIQATREEFLLPELEPAMQPG